MTETNDGYTKKWTRVVLSIAEKIKYSYKLKEGEARQKIVNEMGMGIRTLDWNETADSVSGAEEEKDDDTFITM